MPQARADHLNRSPSSRRREAAVGGQHKAREPCRLRDADARLRGGHRALRGGDVGAARQHGARHAGGDHRHRDAGVRFGQAEARCAFAEQQRERVLELGAAPVEAERFGFGRGDFAAHARHVELGHVARGVAAIDQPQRVLVREHRVAHELALDIEHAQCEVRLRDVGLHQQARALQQRFARLRVGARRHRSRAPAGRPDRPRTTHWRPR